MWICGLFVVSLGVVVWFMCVVFSVVNSIVFFNSLLICGLMCGLGYLVLLLVVRGLVMIALVCWVCDSLLALGSYVYVWLLVGCFACCWVLAMVVVLGCFGCCGCNCVIVW